MNGNEIKEAVKKGYTKAIEEKSGCCSSTSTDSSSGAESGSGRCCWPGETEDSIGNSLGYSKEELENLPQGVIESSFGCGNPLAFTGIKEGQTVLDIGSGAGMDCLIAAGKVGPTGKVIGLDMTPAMIEQARKNTEKAGATHVEYRLGDADDMPVEDNSVDWIISNCVINLAPDKDAVFREVARVLKPGGHVSISDIVLGDDLPEEIVNSVDALVGCVAGAVKEGDYLKAMREAGLVEAEVSERMVYGETEIAAFLGECVDVKVELKCCGGNSEGNRESAGKTEREVIKPEQIAGKVWSARIIGRKP